MTDFIDLSMPISPDMPTNVPDHFPPNLRPYSAIEQDGWAGTAITIDSHCGTHVDAPCHFIVGGLGVDQIPLDTLVGDAQRIDIAGAPVGAGDLIAVAAPRVILVAGSAPDGERPPAYLGAEAAESLVSSGVRLVGIDRSSIDAPDCAEVHQILLGNGVIIVENIVNAEALPVTFHLVVSPLRIVDGDGSPARVFALAGTAT